MNTIQNPGMQVDMAFYYIFGFSLILLTGITIAMILFVIKYRRSRDDEGRGREGDDDVFGDRFHD